MPIYEYVLSDLSSEVALGTKSKRNLLQYFLSTTTKSVNFEPFRLIPISIHSINFIRKTNRAIKGMDVYLSWVSHVLNDLHQTPFYLV